MGNGKRNAVNSEPQNMVSDSAVMSLQNLTLFNLIILILGYFILWIIISIPVYLAAKALTGGKASIGEAMLATLMGPVAYVIVVLLVSFLLGAVIGQSAVIWAYILAFIVWIWVFKASFKTNWLAAIGIAVLAVVILIVLNYILGALLGITIPGFFIPTI